MAESKDGWTRSSYAIKPEHVLPLKETLAAAKLRSVGALLTMLAEFPEECGTLLAQMVERTTQLRVESLQRQLSAASNRSDAASLSRALGVLQATS